MRFASVLDLNPFSLSAIFLVYIALLLPHRFVVTQASWLCLSMLEHHFYPSGPTIIVVQGRHGAEQYAEDLELIFSRYHLDKTVPEIPEPVYCLMPSLVQGRHWLSLHIHIGRHLGRDECDQPTIF